LRVAWPKNRYLRAQFLRIKARRGAKRAILTVAASMLTAAYYMLRLVRRIQSHGYAVSVTPQPGPPWPDRRDRTSLRAPPGGCASRWDGCSR
jgi:hypothetical protein